MTLRAEARTELSRLLGWWRDHLVDEGRGGFYGEVDADDRPVPDASKSIILNTRLLWFFSASARHLSSPEALSLADRARAYLDACFLDEAGGVVWQLDAAGQVIDGKKQAYAQAFAIYALAEHYSAGADATSLDLAKRLQALIEAKYWDAARGGYIEALDRDWQPLADQRLSDKDIDAPKTMNTHLHILEAYTDLHRAAPSEATEAALRRILKVFLDRFVGPAGHLRLFFAMDWTDLTHAVSYGHDIEASWLIWEAAKALGDDSLLARARAVVLNLARTAARDGMGPEGGLAYEKSLDGHLDPHGEWWGQAEALVGFVNAWQMTGDRTWLDKAEQVWTFTKAQYGAAGASEWSWYAASAGRDKIYKAGEWKCPYHNGRAMIELMRRLA